jgi:FkbM family methyltransferase
MTIATVSRNLLAFARSGHLPSRRAVAALAKVHGRRLERRWPFLPKAAAEDLNLDFNDLLEFQYARSRSFWVMVVGAYDGIDNDPLCNFVREHPSQAILLEPQPAIFARLRDNLGGRPGMRLVNAAVAQTRGTQDFFFVPPGIEDLPGWTTQLASFDKAHLLKHESLAPGVSRHVAKMSVPTVSFTDLLDQFRPPHLDVLQLDAEGMDALLLQWFPFDRIKPAAIHYEVAHLSTGDRVRTQARLCGMGYRLIPACSVTDEIALLI